MTKACSYIRTHVLIYSGKGEEMRLLKLAIKIQRWDLAAHTIILATARILKNGVRPDAGKSGGKAGHPKERAERH